MSDLELNFVVSGLRTVKRVKLIIYDVDDEFIKKYADCILNDVEREVRFALRDYEYGE